MINLNQPLNKGELFPSTMIEEFNFFILHLYIYQYREFINHNSAR